MSGGLTETPELNRLALIIPEQAFRTLRRTSIATHDDGEVPDTLHRITNRFSDTEDPELWRKQAVEAFLELVREGEVAEDELRAVAFPSESDVNTPGHVEQDVIESLRHFPGVKPRANGSVWRIDPVEANLLIREVGRTTATADERRFDYDLNDVMGDQPPEAHQ